MRSILGSARSVIRIIEFQTAIVAISDRSLDYPGTPLTYLGTLLMVVFPTGYTVGEIQKMFFYFSGRVEKRMCHHIRENSPHLVAHPFFTPSLKKKGFFDFFPTAYLILWAPET